MEPKNRPQTQNSKTNTLPVHAGNQLKKEETSFEPNLTLSWSQ
uniref:Uncharacterized protein n=1 Tax=Anguilla anguilla TaxID=7936 RepID=A0A0E9V4Z2_ANGAN